MINLKIQPKQPFKSEYSEHKDYDVVIDGVLNDGIVEEIKLMVYSKERVPLASSFINISGAVTPEDKSEIHKLFKQIIDNIIP